MISIPRTCSVSVTFLAAIAMTDGAHAQSAPRRLSFRDAVALAIRDGSEIQIAEQGVIASERRVSAAGSQRFPRLRTEGNILYWDKPLDIAFGPMPAGVQQADALRVRDQVTWQASVTLAQPISGLFVLNRLVALEKNGTDAARADGRRVRLDTAQRTAEVYLRLLQARALAHVAEKSVQQTEAQLERAKVLEKGGALALVDVLRLTSARDSAHQSVLRARADVTIAAAALVLSLDLPAGTPIEVLDDLPDPPLPMIWNERDVVALATKERPELVATRERTAQAQAGIDVARAQLLPNVMGVATYQHVEGQAAFQPKDAWFVGATISWDIWDWGKNWDGVKEARARARQSEIGARVLRDQVVFEAQRRLLEARTSYETLAVARSALQAAEEAYRIQTVRYAEGAATTTDVLDAQTDVSRTRSGYAQARYEYYLAQAGVARAVGRLPETDIRPMGAMNANQ